LEQILDAILAGTDRRRLKVHVPLPLARVQAAAMEFAFGTFLGKPPPLNRDQLQMLQEDNMGESSTATRLFALTHSPFREVLATFLSR
jgi:NADH dehydrogenase